MRKARLILSASLLTIGTFSAVTFSSCSKDDKICNVGYEGTDCKTQSRAKFVGMWKGTEACTLGTDEYTITITASSSSEVQIVYSNVYNQNFTATGTMTGTNGFSFSGNGIGTGGGTVTFSGTGALNSSTGVLKIDYTVSSAASNNSCTFTGTKL
jgi:hypothetical protein